MTTRIRKVVTFLAFNLLFFALYLNFVHADAQPYEPSSATKEGVPAFGETHLEKNPEKYLHRPTVASPQP